MATPVKILLAALATWRFISPTPRAPGALACVPRPGAINLITASLIDNFNFKCHFGAVKRISMLEIRQNSRELIERLRKGECFTITYRNRPVGELRPLPAEPADLTGDPIYEAAACAEDLGGGMDAATADQVLYGK